MNRRLSVCLIILLLGMVTGCAYFQKPEPPPPLPPIEEPKPPFTMKSDYFKTFPWSALAEPRKDGNDPDTFTYTMKEGDTLESVAEKMMGSPGLARDLATYNKLPSVSSAGVGDRIVIPYPIIGIRSEVRIKSKGDPDLGAPKPFPVDFKKGDEYKLQFESNVNGYLYVFRKEPKGVTLLYPAAPKKAPTPLRKGKGKEKAKGVKILEPLPRPSGKIESHTPINIPEVGKGFAYDPKNKGNDLVVFFSIQSVPELEALKDKSGIREADLVEVMHRVKEANIFSEAPYKLLRISDPSEVLGFELPMDG